MDHQKRVALYKQYMATGGARMDAAAMWMLKIHTSVATTQIHVGTRFITISGASGWQPSHHPLSRRVEVQIIGMDLCQAPRLTHDRLHLAGLRAGGEAIPVKASGPPRWLPPRQTAAC